MISTCKAGDKISGTFGCFGSVTSSKKDVQISIPLPKSAYGLSFKVTSLSNAQMRCWNEYIGGYKGNLLTGDVMGQKPTDVKATVLNGGAVLHITATYPNDVFGTNNVPFAGTVSIQGTFS